MKTLYIVRHAKSSWDDPNLDDFDRPLNSRGKRDAPEMGKRLRDQGIKPNLLISSAANRAHKTAVTIAKEIGYPKNEIKRTENFYLTSVNSALKIIHQVDNSVDFLMIFGHNPCWTDLANYLCNAHIDNIPTCGITAISFDIDNWAEVNRGKGTLVFFDYPKKKNV